MSINQAFQEAGSRIDQILNDKDITSADRFTQLKGLIEGYLRDGCDDVVDHLLALSFRKSGSAYEIIADCTESHLERGRIVLSNGLVAEGEINVLPMIIEHREDLPLQANWVHGLPPLPDGRRIPGLNDMLLTWDDLTLSRNRVRELHQILPKGSPEERLSGLLSWRASNVQTGRFDRLWTNDNGEDSSLRFLVAYRLQDDADWFAGPDEMREWAASATRRLYEDTGIWVDIKAPRKLIHGIYVGHGQAEQMVIRTQLTDIRRRRIDPKDTSVLIELFGDQYTGVALCARISVIDVQENIVLNQAIFRFGLKSVEARAQHEIHTLSDSCQIAGFSDVRLAKLVQPGERLESSQPVRNLARWCWALPLPSKIQRRTDL